MYCRFCFAHMQLESERCKVSAHRPSLMDHLCSCTVVAHCYSSKGVLPPWSSHVRNPSSCPVIPLVSGCTRITISVSLGLDPGLLLSTVPSSSLFSVTIKPREMLLSLEIQPPPPYSARKEKISMKTLTSCNHAEWLWESEMVTCLNINILYTF